MHKHLNIKDYDIQALVDNELPWEQAKGVIAHIEENRQAQIRYQELYLQKQMLQEWWAKKH